jgi:hypothetical protein
MSTGAKIRLALLRGMTWNPRSNLSSDEDYRQRMSVGASFSAYRYLLPSFCKSSNIR